MAGVKAAKLLVVAASAATALGRASPGSGVTACYSPTTFPRFASCAISQIDPALDFQWETLPFGAGVPWSVTWSGMLTPPQPGNYSFSVETDSPISFTTLRVDDHPLVVAAGPGGTPGGGGNQSGFYPVPIPRYSYYNVPQFASSAKVHIEFTFTGSTGPLSWRLLVAGPGLAAPAPVPASWLSPSLPPWEASYLTAKEAAESGLGGADLLPPSRHATPQNAAPVPAGDLPTSEWGTYYTFDLLAVSHLPDGLTASFSLIVDDPSAGGNQTLTRLGSAGPSCESSSSFWGDTRLGVHGTGAARSLYAQVEHVGWHGYGWGVEYAVLHGGADVAVVLTTTAVPGSPASSPAYLNLSWMVPPEWAPRWCDTAAGGGYPGGVPTLTAACPGGGATQLQLASDTPEMGSAVVDAAAGTLTLGPLPTTVGASIAFYTGESTYTTGEIVALVASARAALLSVYATYGVDGADADNETAAGLSAAIGWNTIYSPLEGLIAPVFRGAPWRLAARGYVLFLWDTFLSSYLALASGDGWVALNNAVRMVKSITSDGSILGHWEGTCGELNSKPPLASGALTAIVKALGDAANVSQWLVPLVAEPLVVFSTWWDATRFVAVNASLPSATTTTTTTGPSGAASSSTVRLLAPGALTTPCGCATQRYPGIQGAIYETGLDNSPMYDNASWVKVAFTMDQADVGMSALYARDAQLLAELLASGSLPPTANASAWERECLARGNATASAVESASWSDSDSLWLNVVWTGAGAGTFVRVPTPTSFYPLLTSAPSSDRVHAALSRWLTNSTEFCVTGSDPVCTNSTLPSVTRSLPSGHDNNYWRGRAWGPMSFLTYSGLVQYEGGADAAVALAEQARTSFLGNWVGSRRVMENYNSATGEGCDSPHAIPFYHWGALHALIALDARGKLPPGLQGILRA